MTRGHLSPEHLDEGEASLGALLSCCLQCGGHHGLLCFPTPIRVYDPPHPGDVECEMMAGWLLPTVPHTLPQVQPALSSQPREQPLAEGRAQNLCCQPTWAVP